MNTPPCPHRPARWQRWLALALIGLLALGPFLHSHFGVSHDTGFHVDGLHEVHHLNHDASSTLGAQTSTPSSMQASTPDDESPALCVSASLPQNGDALAWPLALWLVLAVVPLLPADTGHPCPPCPTLRTRPVYRPGMPPPGLPPPHA